MSRCHCSSGHPVGGGDRRREAGVGHAHVDVAERGELVAGDVELQVASLAQVEREDLEAVRCQALGDRRADPARGAGHQRPAPLGQTVALPAHHRRRKR